MSAEQTKAQLLEEVAALRADGARMGALLGGIDPETRALSDCIHALDRITPRTSTYTGRPSADVGRVLRYLAQRYGVSLVERVTEPCDLTHLADASDDELVARLRGFA